MRKHLLIKCEKCSRSWDKIYSSCVRNPLDMRKKRGKPDLTMFTNSLYEYDYDYNNKKVVNIKCRSCGSKATVKEVTSKDEILVIDGDYFLKNDVVGYKQWNGYHSRYDERNKTIEQGVVSVITKDHIYVKNLLNMYKSYKAKDIIESMWFLK